MTSYGEAGVSLAKAEAVVEQLRAAVESTRTEQVEGSLGAFAGLFALDDERLLAATIDGVGTKLILSRRAGRLFDAGVDLVAHCANDLLTVGAEPLFFLDYAAAAELDLAEVAELVAGAASVCREAGCAILGGETAELPGDLPRGGARLRGDDGRPRAPRRPGGRLALRARRRRPGAPVERAARERVHARPPSVLGDADFDADLLLAPTRLYLEDVRRLRQAGTCGRSPT